ncbi:uncharacterized protein LOC125959463 [Anopheles darlingi]|uniref:uncharacterized protein LOC125959463 n=1 Tax=Anopheles darlingi TaxID=43151 RepID=UPI0020FFFA4D|nr:uncharacterized protein LOC125959463 [Anopheles darlingi]
MLNITFNALRSRPSIAPVWGQLRWRSTQSQPAAAEHIIERDPEWDNARSYDDIPSPTLFGFLKEFGPFGKYKDATLYDINCRMRELYGPIMRMKGSFGREDIVLSFNPEDFEKVFRTEGVWPRRTGMDAFVYYRKQQRPEYFKGYGGLLAEQGEAWHNMRTIVNPIMLQPKIIKLYIEKVDEVAREFIGIVDGLRDTKHELPADFNEWLNRWALETMGVLVLDTRLGVLNREQTPEVQKLIRLTKDAVSLFFYLDIMPSMWRKIKTPGFYRLMRTLDELYHIIASKIDEAVVRMEKNPSVSSDSLSILEKLLKVDRNAAFIMSLDSLFAGVDTTSSGSTGILYCLAHNPEKQDKLREELRKILPDKNSKLTAENMKNMPYLRACIKEGLRMYPPTTGNGRCVGKDLVLQGYRIPKGTMVAMGQLVLQRQEGQFTRPSEFLPERWLSGPETAGCPSAKEAHPFVYMPFGFGARTCIGRRLAMMEMEILVSRLIRQYHVRWNYGEIKFRASVVNVPSTDLKFELQDSICFFTGVPLFTTVYRLKSDIMLCSSSIVVRRGIASSSQLWRSVQAAPQLSNDDLIDSEWATAKPYESIPGPNIWKMVTGFMKGGRYADLSLVDLHSRLRDDFGSIIRMPGLMGRRDIVMSFDPEDFEKVFRTEGTWPVRRGLDTMAYYRQKLRPEVFGEMGGLVTEQGESWQKMRTIVNPVMMQPKTMRLYVDKVDEVAREFLEIVAGLRDSKQELPGDFDQWINRWALETMGVLALDTRFGVLKTDQTEEAKKILALVRNIFDFSYQLDALPSVWRYYKTPTFNNLMTTFDELTDIIMAKVDDAVKRIEKHPTAEGNQSVLEKLLKIDKHVAVIMALDMLMAGIDTTSSGSMGMMYCLAKNPDKQSKLRDELRTIMPNKDSPLTAENMRNLPYLRACIKEGLRMFPPVVGNFRATGRNIVLQGYRIPKDTDVGMGSLVLQHDEKRFTRAKEFLPERWLADRDADIPSGKDANPFIFLPFGFGSRSCIGKRLAMMEMEIITARLIRKYEARWNYEDFKVRATLVNIPSNPLRFELKEVDH